MSNNQTQKINVPNKNPFMPISKEFAPKESPKRKFDKEIEVYNLIPKAKKIADSDGVQHDVVVYESTFIRKYSIQDYIDSFSGEVGIQNILKKLALSGDKSLLNQTGRENLCPEGGLEPIQDYSNVPQNKTDAFNAVLKGVEAYDNLPAELKGKMSFAQVASLVQADDIDAYVKSLLPKEETNNE